MKSITFRAKAAFLRRAAVLAVLVAACAMSSGAYDFKVGDLCYGKYPSSMGENLVYVTYEQEAQPRYAALPPEITIPSQVTYRDTTFTVTAIGASAFNACEGLTKVTISSGVQGIEDGAFSRCTSLASVTIPSTVVLIGQSAFSGCSSLTGVVIPNSVTTVGSHVFYECAALKNVTLPDNIKVINSYSFCRCKALESITIPNSVTSINGWAFLESGLKHVVLSENLKSVYIMAFKNCPLESLAIPASLTTIEWSELNSAFERTCKTLKSITVAEGNPVYDSRGNCNAIINTSTNTLMLGCRNTVIPSTVTTINGTAFCTCSGMKSIEIPNSVTKINDFAFEYSSLEQLHIPSSVTSIGSRSFVGCPLTSVTVDSGNSRYDSRDNCNAIISAGNTLMLGCKNSTVPATVTSIGAYAFMGKSELTAIELPESLRSIGQYAFSGCSGLSSLELPPNLTNISYFAFANTGLTRISIPPLVNTLPDGAFYGCNKLTEATLSEGLVVINKEVFCRSGLKKIVIPNTVTTINKSAFRNSADLTTATLGSGVKTIDAEAFASCTNLQRVFCLAAEPPTAPPSAFAPNHASRKFYVPAGSVEAYKGATGWSRFADVIFPLASGGDLNGDGEVTVGDVSAVYDVILGHNDDLKEIADINGDGEVTVADASVIFSFILGN